MRYTLFPDYDILTRSVDFENLGSGPVVLDEVNSVTVDFPPAMHSQPYHLTQLSGSWARERHQVTRLLNMGVTAIESRRGASSHQHNPFILLSEG